MHRLLCLLLLFVGSVTAEPLALKNGHLKGQYLLGSYPDDSVLKDLVGSPTHDGNGELRLLLGGGHERWSWQGDYQLTLRSGDTVELGRQLAGNFLVPNALPRDDTRLMDLTRIISDRDDRNLVHRLDRLHVNYAGDNAVLKLGRQAVSWGNGLIYNPVDFFNPFDPAAVDKEFKSGDDMFYGQYLQDSGNDAQFVWVWRRDENGNTDPDVDTQALKYHAFIGERELDLLLARHYSDEIASIGGISNWGGAILRGDVLLTHTDHDTYTSAVANLSYSWVWGGKNMTGVLEYFYNGIGLREKHYDDIAQEEDLLARLQRGELFTLGRHYIAGAVTVELAPLFNLTPNLFLNLGDGSGLAQVVGQYDLHQDWQLLLAMNLPFGSDGTEFGGLDVPMSDRQFSVGPGVFAQIAFYF